MPHGKPLFRPALWLVTLALSSMLAAVSHADPIEASVGTAVENFHAVVPGKIYRGAIPRASGLAALARAGIRTDIDLQGGDVILGIPVEEGESDDGIAQESQAARASGVAFLSEPMSAINPDTDDQEATIEEVLKLIADPAAQPVYFHCRHGSDRTGLIAALYRVLYQGCTPDQAHAEWMKYGHSRLLPWMDHYFNERIRHDPRTHAVAPSPDCPLPSAEQ